MTTILEGLREYLSQCPALREVRTDLAGEKDGSCALVPQSEKVVRESITGAVVRTGEFRLHLRFALSSERERQENHTKLEEMTGWLDKRRAQGILPELPEGNTALDLQCVRGALKRAEGGGTGIYELPLRLTYEKEGE